MSEQKTTDYKKYITYIKDTAYVIAIIIALSGWLTSKSKNEAVLETTVKHNTETLNKMEKFMDKQAELNGKIIQFMTQK